MGFRQPFPEATSLGPSEEETLQEEEKRLSDAMKHLDEENQDEREDQTVNYPDGSVYRGMLKDGLRHGTGTFAGKTFQCKGQWSDDSLHGDGEQWWNDGRKYIGQFKAGQFHGAGKMVWETNGKMFVYEGQYQNDLKDGKGKFVWPSGSTYEGEWSEGKRHGQADFTAHGETKTGYWVDDKFDRWASAAK